MTPTAVDRGRDRRFDAWRARCDVLRERRLVLAEDHPDVAVAVVNAANAARALDPANPASDGLRAAYASALTVLTRAYGDHDVRVAAVLNNLACTADHAADDLFERALTTYEALGDRAGAAAVLVNIGCAALGRRDEMTAVDVIQRALAMQEGLFGRSDVRLVKSLVALGCALDRAGEATAARAALLRAMEIQEAVPHPDREAILVTLYTIWRSRTVADARTALLYAASDLDATVDDVVAQFSAEEALLLGPATIDLPDVTPGRRPPPYRPLRPVRDVITPPARPVATATPPTDERRVRGRHSRRPRRPSRTPSWVRPLAQLAMRAGDAIANLVRAHSIPLMWATAPVFGVVAALMAYWDATDATLQSGKILVLIPGALTIGYDWACRGMSRRRGLPLRATSRTVQVRDRTPALASAWWLLWTLVGMVAGFAGAFSESFM